MSWFWVGYFVSWLFVGIFFVFDFPQEPTFTAGIKVTCCIAVT